MDMIQDPDYHIWGTYFTESCLVYSFFLHWHSNYLCLKCFDSWLSTRKAIWTVKNKFICEWWSCARLGVLVDTTFATIVSCCSEIQNGFTPTRVFPGIPGTSR